MRNELDWLPSAAIPFDRAVEQLAAAVYATDAEGVIVHCNPAATELLGRDPLGEKHWSGALPLFYPDGQPMPHDSSPMARVLESGRPIAGEEAVFERPDGNRISVLCYSAPLRDETGTITGATHVLVDVTDRTRAEEWIALSAGISQILSEAMTLDEAAPRILKELSDHFRADVAELWLGVTELRCVSIHSRLAPEQDRAFRAVTQQLSLRPGDGLPGYAFQARTAVWLDQVADQSKFVRRELATELGLNTGVAIPIVFGQTCLGAICCFMRQPLRRAPPLLTMMTSLGLKLGQFVERVRGEERSRYLAAVVEASTDSIVTVSTDGIITSWNQGAERLYGYSADEAVGRAFTILVPPDKFSERQTSLARLRRGERVEPVESIRLDKAGRRIPVSLSYSAMRGAAGEIIGFAAISRDISEQLAAQRQIEARLRQLDAISDVGMFALAADDLRSVFDTAMAQLAEGLEVDLTTLFELQSGGRNFVLRAGLGWRDVKVDETTEQAGPASQSGYTLQVGNPVIVEDLNAETRFQVPRLVAEHGVVSGLSVIVPGDEHQPFGVLCAHSRTARRFSDDDVHFVQSIANILSSAIERDRYRLRQDILLQELTHRVKNSLSVVQALAGQTSRHSSSMEEFVHSFQGRLIALAEAHELLTENTWSGARLKMIAELVIGGQIGSKRVSFDLEDIELTAAATQDMAMVFHELTTNATKYGALSRDAGTVALHGRRDESAGEPVYRLVWCEVGGPSVERPTRTGFGSQFIAGTIAHRLGGELTLKWDRPGLAAEMVLPIAGIAAQ